MPHQIKSSFPKALRLTRKAKGLTQEDFDDVSSRVYISALERGVKQPTLPKVEALASKLGIHPLTLLMLSYLSAFDSDELKQLTSSIQRECLELIVVERSPQD
jgi:transcriptional regulator with XRE-family HTH domain